MRPPGGVYFAALVSRFVITCASRAASASTIRPRRGTSTLSVCARCSSIGPAVSIARATDSASSSGCLRSSIWPRAMRATSMRSSTRWIRWLTWRSITVRARSAASGLHFHQLHGGEDRRQRVAQLVAEHRQEFVLGAVGTLGGEAQAVDLLARLLRQHEVAHAHQQVLVGERLDEVVLRAVVEELHHQRLVGTGRQQQDRRQREFGALAHLVDHLGATDAGHQDVGHDQRRAHAQRHLQSLAPSNAEYTS